MNGLMNFANGFLQLISAPSIILIIIAGVFMGVVFGSIPGLTGALAISLVLPFTYHMATDMALPLLIAIYVGSIAGGLISAILLNIPGTPASLVTCFDGSPMAKRGEHAKALVIGTFSSLVGGLIGGFALIFISGPLATFALKFDYWEYFSMGIMGLCVIVALVGKDPLKGFMAACIGVLIGMFGTDDVTAVPRFTFGLWQLNAGFANLPVLMGFFAITEILTSLRTISKKVSISKIGKIPLIPKREWLKGTGKTMLASSVIGTCIGILPGVGQTTASLMAYSTAKSNSKTPEAFGTGCSEGIVASEAANNAVCGGALIPMMAIGIPGDVITAILLGALTMHGLQPGPLLFNTNGAIVGLIFAAYVLANIVMYVMMLGMMSGFAQMLRVPVDLLYPVIVIACMVGGMATNNRIFEAGVLVIFGIVGYFLVNNDYPIPPLVLGYVLSKIIERNFRVAMIATDDSFWPLLTRPIALVLLAFGFFMLCLPVIRRVKARRKSKTE